MGESASAAACDPAADGPGDAELIARVRRGDTAAYERLYTRHRKAAQSAARRYAPRASDADDLVAEAFTSVLEAIRKGAGPREFFRAYLVRTIANYGFRTGKQQRRAVLTDVWEGYDQAEQPPDTAADAFDRKAVVSAFRSLPERWQAVLWHTEIEGETPAAVAPLLGLNANGVSALAYRAREGLRTAYVQAHLTHAPSESCRRYVDRLSAYVRDKLGKRDAAGVHGHLDSCDHCRGLYLELADVSAALRASVAPVLLGAAAAGYLVSASGSTATATATATVPPRPRRLPRPRRPRLPGRGLTTSAVVGAAAVAAGTAWALVSAGGTDHAVKDGQGAAGKPARPLPAVSSGPPAAEPPPAEPAQSEPTPDGGVSPEPSSLLVIPAASTPPPVPADPLPTTAAPGPTRPPAPEPSTAEPKRTANPGPGPGNSPEPQPTPTPGPSVTPDPGPSTTPTPGPSTTPDPGPSTTPDPKPSTTPTPKPSTTPDPKPSTTPGPDPTGGTGCEPGDWSGHGHWCPCTDHHWFPGCKPRTAPAVAARPPAPMRLPYPVAWSRPGDGRRPAA